LKDNFVINDFIISSYRFINFLSSFIKSKIINSKIKKVIDQTHV